MRRYPATPAPPAVGRPRGWPGPSDKGSENGTGRRGTSINSVNDTGRHEVYVKKFPLTDAQWQVSREGGVQARPATSGTWPVRITTRTSLVFWSRSGE